MRPGAAASRPDPGRTPEVPVRDSRNSMAGPTPDDLQKITGIGAALAARLAEAGVTTYQELACHAPQQLAALTRVPSAKIVSQDWAGQARRLAGSALTEPDGQQKYATFHVELLIDADNTVRRTKTRHFQTDTEESWPGWDDQRLIAVMRRKAALDAPAAKPPLPGPSGSPAPPPIHADGPSPAEEGTTGTFRVAGQPTAARLTFRVGPGLDAGDMDYTVAVAARSLADGQCHPLAPADGTAATGRPVTLELAGQPLPPGIHRLEATVTVYGHRHQPGDPPLARHRVLGDLVHVAARPARQPASCPRLIRVK
jgi:predicted flap endonuclease-1-like 5' DNA nuclease